MYMKSSLIAYIAFKPEYRANISGPNLLISGTFFVILIHVPYCIHITPNSLTLNARGSGP